MIHIDRHRPEKEEIDREPSSLRPEESDQDREEEVQSVVDERTKEHRARIRGDRGLDRVLPKTSPMRAYLGE